MCSDDLISVSDLIKRCSARLYLQRCCAADRVGNTQILSLDDVYFILANIVLCSSLQQFAADCGDDDLFVDIDLCSGLQ